MSGLGRSWVRLLGAAGSACLAVLGGFALAGWVVRLDVAGWLGDPVPGQQAAALGADKLSGLFLALSFGAAVPVCVAGLARGGRQRGGAACMLALKSLLFTSAAGLEHDDLEELRGGRRGWSGFGLAVGSLTLAGLPPTVGFVSEWFLLESLMQQFRVPGLGYRLVLALAGAAVALTVGFAGVTFVRLVGLVVLGARHRVRAGPGRVRLGWPGGCSRAGPGLPGDRGGHTAGDPGDRRRAVARGPGLADHARAEVAVDPAAGVPGFSILSPSWLWVEMPLMLLLLTVLFAWAVSGRRLWRVRRVPAWRSATMGVEGADSYTAFGYANPTRRVLAGVLHTRAELREVMMADNDRDDGSGPPDRADPGRGEAAAHLRYASDVIEAAGELDATPAERDQRDVGDA